MKILTDAGTVLIVGRKPFAQRRGGHHDGWQAHGISMEFSGGQGLSEQNYFGPTFLLKDGEGYVYFSYKGPDSYAIYQEWLDDAATPMPPDYRAHYGEAYNYIIRPKAFTKIKILDVQDWLLAH